MNWNFLKKEDIEKNENVSVIENDVIKDIEEIEDWKPFLSKMKSNHNFQEFSHQLSVAIMTAKAMDEDEAKYFLSILYAVELSIHGSKQEAHRCLKENMDGKLSNVLIDGVYPGIIDKVTPKAIKEIIQRNTKKITSTRLGKIMKITLKIGNLYLDPWKDWSILWLLIGLVGARAIFTPEFFSFYPVQIIWILGASLILPLVISSLQIAIFSPLAIFGYKIEKEKNKIPTYQIFLVRIFTVVFFPLVPALLVLSTTEDEEKLEEFGMLLEENRAQNKDTKDVIRKMLSVQMFLKKTKKMILKIRTNKTLENYVQLVIQTLMLLLNQSSTSTTRGLEEVFGEKHENASGSETLLYMSILLSLRSMITVRIKAKKASFDGVLPSIATLIVGLRSFLVTLLNITCVVAFFAPYMGLLHILQHLKAEQIPQEKGIEYPELFRADYQTDTPTTPGANTYIGTLQAGYGIFLGILTVQVLLLLFFKMAMKKSTKLLSLFQDVLNTFSNPDAGFDWSHGTGDVASYRQRKKHHLVEVMCESFLQWTIQMIMLVPLWVVGRH